MLTQELLKKYLHYDPDTGIFTWIWHHSAANFTKFVGKRAGHLNSNKPYRSIYMTLVKGGKGKAYKEHVLAWLYMTGEIPSKGFEIDHRDIDKSNNKWENLRIATHAQNMANQTRNNKGLPKGVTRREGRVRYVARITYKGKLERIGLFRSSEEAQAAYLQRAEELYGEFARG